MSYSPKIDSLLRCCVAAQFTAADFAALCLAAADQAGMGADDQHDLAKMLNPECRDCSMPIGDYGASEKDERVTPSAGFCEQCHTDEVRAVLRERKRNIEEGRGDYMRDQRKDVA